MVHENKKKYSVQFQSKPHTYKLYFFQGKQCYSEV